jgi:hypothetical protein
MNEPTQMPDAGGAAVQDRSTFAVILDVFFSPAKAFATHAARPRILLPIIIMLILIGAASYLSTPYQAQMQLDMLSQSSSLPPEFLEQARQDAENPSPWGGTIGAPVVILLITLIEAAIALFLGKVIFGGDAKFKAIWGVGMLTALIPSIGGLLRMPLVFAQDTLLVSIGPAALLAGKDFTSFMYLFLYFLDLFAIWGIIVAGIGYAAVFGISRGKGYTIAIIATGLLTVFGATVQWLLMGLGGVETTFF